MEVGANGKSIWQPFESDGSATAPLPPGVKPLPFIRAVVAWVRGSAVPSGIQVWVFESDADRPGVGLGRTIGVNEDRWWPGGRVMLNLDLPKSKFVQLEVQTVASDWHTISVLDPPRRIPFKKSPGDLVGGRGVFADPQYRSRADELAAEAAVRAMNRPARSFTPPGPTRFRTVAVMKDGSSRVLDYAHSLTDGEANFDFYGTLHAAAFKFSGIDPDQVIRIEIQERDYAKPVFLVGRVPG